MGSVEKSKKAQEEKKHGTEQGDRTHERKKHPMKAEKHSRKKTKAAASKTETQNQKERDSRKEEQMRERRESRGRGGGWAGGEERRVMWRDLALESGAGSSNVAKCRLRKSEWTLLAFADGSKLFVATRDLSPTIFHFKEKWKQLFDLGILRGATGRGGDGGGRGAWGRWGGQGHQK